MRIVKKYLSVGKTFIWNTPYHLKYIKTLLLKEDYNRQAVILPVPSTFNLYWTSPENIGLHGTLPFSRYGFWTLGGDWKSFGVCAKLPIVEKVEETKNSWPKIVHETVRMMFVDEEDYRETPQYKFLVSDFNNRGVSNSAARVDSYFESLYDTFESMKKNGYLTQKELGYQNSSEARLHVTKNGRLCIGSGGNHRVRIAELLQIKKIPFIIGGLHTEFVAGICEKFNCSPHNAIDHWIESVDFIETKENRT